MEATEAAEGQPEEPDVDTEPVEEEGSVDATDAAERKAGELDVDLASVEGTGQGGRITVGDVEKASKTEDGD